ncbi:MAG: FRG domain-containing protein [Terracidiphilus sp.]
MESREGNWQEFEIWLQELQNRKYRRGLIFRGQADSKWRLETTLERSGHSTMPIADYYDLIVRKVGPNVSAFSSMQAPSFNESLWEEISDYARHKVSIFDPAVFPGGEHFEYAAYLRHHGFPSPLLDWSQSPYAAAFFAFRDAAPKVEKRAIFVYCDRPKGTKYGIVGKPTIRPVIGNTRTPRRHFFQQSIYTVCESANSGKWQFDSHQKVFDNPNPKQDFLGKFVILSTEREKVMGLLDQYNLNAYSLFESEESLLETLWFRANRK